ncbi:pyroglutamyl-peptidase 1 [Aedes albopictus]|uniref:Pyroglutamyl-peptidase 1 n=1 Tax=Aedes albopictus TaxID=7160 RepID=A0ABM1ZNB2_AEDAL|nr:pyroglutamyl-peptidase 1 [Aedes albopictus]
MSRIIYVTGFGPFAGHEERNASWEAVKLLPDTYHHKNIEYRVKKLEIPVTYEAVDAVVPKIWNENPALVIHVGVHGRIETINLEKCSYSSGYCRPDFANKCLPCDKISLKSATAEGKCEYLETSLDVEAIARELDAVKCQCSREVGSYLCGYIYLKSLDVDRDRTLFIHVPGIGKPYSSEQTKDAIYQVMDRCIRQLDSKGML